MKFLLVVTIITLANANPVPKMLTEEQFLSSGGLDGDKGAVDIVSGYAQIRRQGRNFGSGDKFKYTRPLTVKDPADFQPPTDARRISFDDEKAPVFNLNQIINEEAEKLKVQIEIASLMAAHAAEAAANRITEAAKEAEAEITIDSEQVEKIIEKVVDTGIMEAEEMVKSEIEESKMAEEESEMKIEEELTPEVETIKPEVSEVQVEIEEVRPAIEEVNPEVEANPEEEVKVEEEEPLPVEEVKNTNVEWAQDDQATLSTSESITPTDDEKIDQPEEELKEEVPQTTVAGDGEEAANKSDESNNAAGVTTDSSQPPQDLDLGSVQEV